MVAKILGGLLVTALVFGTISHFLQARKINQLTRQVELLESQKLALEIETKAKDATIKHLESIKKVQVRVTNEKRTVDEAVQSGDLNAVRNLYNKYRVQPSSKGGTSSGN